MKVAVLGCGPAGLMAAYAAESFGGAEVSIFSKKRKSEMFGAQYLHDEIPGIVLPDPVEILYDLVGTPEDYCMKVYGEEQCSQPGFVSSASTLERNHNAWDIRGAYNWLWSRYQDRIVEADIHLHWPQQGLTFSKIFDAFGLVVNSVPRINLCVNRVDHVFRSQEIYSVGDAPERGIFSPVKNASPNTVVLNGFPDVGWYRSSNIHGYNTVEWSANGRTRTPPLEGISRVIKPLSHNCDCWPQILHVGRYGEWNKGVLSHSAFYNTLDRMA